MIQTSVAMHHSSELCQRCRFLPLIPFCGEEPEESDFTSSNPHGLHALIKGYHRADPVIFVDFIWLRLRDLRGLCGGLGTMENCCSIESPQPMCSALSSTTSFQQRAAMPVTAKNRKVMKLGTRIKSVQISMVALISQSLTSFGFTLAKNDVTNMRQNVM